MRTKSAWTLTREDFYQEGRALHAGLAEATSDLVVFLDADVANTTPDFVLQMVQPLLENPEIQFVKAYYVRPLHGMPTDGGRVNVQGISCS